MCLCEGEYGKFKSQLPAVDNLFLNNLSLLHRGSFANLYILKN